jgi:alpha-L-fucosidase
MVKLKLKPTSSLWLFLFLLSSPLLYCTVWYYNHSLFPSNLPLPQKWAPFVQVPLSSYLNNKGIGSAPGQGDFDGSGFSYPASQLPPAGQTIINGVPYLFPNSAPRANDNIAALGQTIRLPHGNYWQVFVLVSTSWGSVNDKIIVHYTDGSSSSGLVNSDDWRIGSSGVINLDYRYSPTGIDQGPVHIYAIQIPIDRTKTASSLTLPMTAQPSPYTPSLHVFALTLQQ